MDFALEMLLVSRLCRAGAAALSHREVPCVCHPKCGSQTSPCMDADSHSHTPPLKPGGRHTGLPGCDCGHCNQPIREQIPTGRVTETLVLCRASLGLLNVGRHGGVRQRRGAVGSSPLGRQGQWRTVTLGRGCVTWCRRATALISSQPAPIPTERALKSGTGKWWHSPAAPESTDGAVAGTT